MSYRITTASQGIAPVPVAPRPGLPAATPPPAPPGAGPAAAAAMLLPAAAHQWPAMLTPTQRTELLLLAVERPELAWRPSRDIADARNAHSTNTYHEMSEALADDYDYLEGDVRVLPDGRPVMWHDHADPLGMSLEEWLEVGQTSGRGLKLDVKEASALEPVLQLLLRRGVDPSRLIINVTIGGMDHEANIGDADLRRIRSLFPTAIVNLSFSTNQYGPDLVRIGQHAALLVGKPVMFPLRADIVNQGVISALKPFGRIAIWNSPDIWSPGNVAAEIARLRSWGVDGTIDLRRGGLSRLLTGPFVQTSASLFGWTFTMSFLRAVKAWWK